MRVSIKKKNIELKTPFEYYLGKLFVLPYAEISIKSSRGIVGKGEIACAIDVNGETSDSAVSLTPLIEGILKKTEIDSERDIIQIMNRINLEISFNAATKCGIEQALYQILATRKKVSLAQALGAKKKQVKIQTNISFLDSTQYYLDKFAEILPKNPSFIKFKVGKDLELESWAINKLRSLNAKVGINIDANQAFPNAREALKFLQKLKNSNLSWAEQLVEKNDIASWEELKKKTRVPLMADESVHTAKDALLFLQNGWIDYINIKLAKSGGIIEARKIVKLAKKYKVRVMLGSMLHGELGTKYNLAFALSEDFVTHGFYNYFSLANVNKNRPLINKDNLKTTNEVYEK